MIAHTNMRPFDSGPIIVLVLSPLQMKQETVKTRVGIVFDFCLCVSVRGLEWERMFEDDFLVNMPGIAATRGSWATQ